MEAEQQDRRAALAAAAALLGPQLSARQLNDQPEEVANAVCLMASLMTGWLETGQVRTRQQAGAVGRNGGRARSVPERE